MRNSEAPFNGLPLTVPLWEGPAPFAGKAHPGLPRITIYLPSEEFHTGQALILCPGGGYGGLSIPKEGHRIARYVSSHGIAAAVLEYRHSPYHHPVPLIDAQRAIRLVRHHAKEWSIEPNQVGILGFSAGGHLAGCAATQASVTGGLKNDGIDQEVCRPDFAALIYPVITFQSPHGHEGSHKNLLGSTDISEMSHQLSLESAVQSTTPPTLLIHTNEDLSVPPENSLLFYQALRAHKIPTELHIYENGGHGIGLSENHPWGPALLQWMKNRRQ